MKGGASPFAILSFPEAVSGLLQVSYHRLVDWGTLGLSDLPWATPAVWRTWSNRLETYLTPWKFESISVRSRTSLNSYFKHALLKLIDVKNARALCGIHTRHAVLWDQEPVQGLFLFWGQRFSSGTNSIKWRQCSIAFWVSIMRFLAEQLIYTNKTTWDQAERHLSG